MRSLAASLFVAVLAAACGNGRPAPTPTPLDLSRRDLRAATLDAAAVGEGWTQREDAGPNTVQIGGRAGAANVRPVRAEATTAFERREDDGHISNTILLLRSEQTARAVISAHQEAARRTSWTQEREDGGRTAFTFDGAVADVDPLGDAMFAARLKATVTTPDGRTSEHAVEYVVFSLGPLVAFVVTQDVGAGLYARRLEPRVARLLSDA
jgi:hypothetical protein